MGSGNSGQQESLLAAVGGAHAVKGGPGMGLTRGSIHGVRFSCMYSHLAVRAEIKNKMQWKHA